MAIPPIVVVEFGPKLLQVPDHPRGEFQVPGEYGGEWQAVIDGVPEGTALGTC
jgi:hypothetical protein